MQRSFLRVLIGVVGAFAIAKGVGQLNVVFKMLGMLMSDDARGFIIFDWVTGIAVLSPLVLLAVGCMLLAGFPHGLIERLWDEVSYYRALIGIVGLFIIVIGIEQIQPFSASMSRIVEQTYYINRVWGIIVSVSIVLFPVMFLGLGFYFLGANFNDSDEKSSLSAIHLWTIAYMFVGALVLSFALPRIPQIVTYFNINFRLGAQGDRNYLLISHCSTILSFLLETALGTYLLLGAPHLVRWHVRRIEKSSS